jgi:inorganic pyrophosphatase
MEEFNKWRPHPWHGLSEGEHAPDIVNAYIEMTPFGSIKYEVDKETGYLKVDRPQKTTAQLPTLYGFIPRTYCAKRVQALSPKSTQGDMDPLDICVISERPVTCADILLDARIVGGIQMIDDGEADDKIVAILANDSIYGHIRDISELPQPMIERLRHYFMTYKLVIGKEQNISVDTVYGKDHAVKVLEAALADYQEAYGE